MLIRAHVWKSSWLICPFSTNIYIYIYFLGGKSIILIPRYIHNDHLLICWGESESHRPVERIHEIISSPKNYVTKW